LGHLFGTYSIFQFSGSAHPFVFLTALRLTCRIPQPVITLRVPSVFGMVHNVEEEKR